MKRLERLVVHVEEAIRLGMSESEPRLRLGLMTIDSAAELLMYRETDYLLRWDARDGESLRQAEEALERGYGDQQYVDQLRAKVLSKTKRNKIERDFNEKCDYLVQEGALDVTHARVLKKLHEYRNETYHRDGLRPAILDSVTRIYIYLVCTMMIKMPMHSMSTSSSVPPKALMQYMEPGENGYSTDFDLQARIGQKLLTASGIGEQTKLGEALAEYVVYRLDEIVEMVEECVSTFNETTRFAWDFVSVLGSLQAPEPADPFDYLRRTVEDYRNWAKPVNMAKFRAWRKAAEELATETDDLKAFALFADLEDEFEPIEKKVMQMGLETEMAVQHQTDIALGK